MTRTCEALNAAGSYSDGIAIVEDAAGNMTAFPATLPARLLSPFACSCQINKGCETCIIDCVDFYWALPNSSWYPSGVDCSDDRAKIVRTEGSAAFSIYKPVVTNSSSEGIWWDCNGEACEKPPSPVDPEHPYQGTTRSYGSPNIEIVVSKMMSRMCSIALCVLALLGSCLFLQLLNLQIIWTTVRGADDMSVDDAFRLEQRILYSCCFTSVVTLIPAFLYGAYVALFMDDADWGVTHSLGPGW
ncbi:hypothetical protein T484DRAFT_3246193 [Baffinella frigidus]|nr:hypothetical protein T484DRAFT_3246193 [Cryptophyta sp. CCMP2293]